MIRQPRVVCWKSPGRCEHRVCLQELVLSLADLLSHKKPCNVASRISKHGQLRASRHFGRRKNVLPPSRSTRSSAACKSSTRAYTETRLLRRWSTNATVDAPGPPPVSTIPYFIGLSLSIFHPKSHGKTSRVRSFATHDFEMNNRCSMDIPPVRHLMLRGALFRKRHLREGL